MPMRYQRQVDRAFDPVRSLNHPIKQDAMAQVRSAWVLHVNAMIDSLKWDISQILHLRCAYCRHRHLYHAYSRHYKDGSWEHCDYGWWFSVRLIFRKARFHLMQGTD